MKEAILLTLKKDTDEIKALAETLDYEVVEEFIQRRNIPDVRTYIGIGKLEEIKEFLEEHKGVDLVIVDGSLKPSQWFSLEKELKRDVYDRIRLILSIFSDRANSREAKLQVKLAQLRYERPFVRELIHRARAGEHPGFMAGGEYQVDDYYEMIKRQMKSIYKELERIRRSREIRRKHRRNAGFYVVAIAGYTNAGKSTLLNLLSKGDVKVDNNLFSTLSPTTKRISPGMKNLGLKPPVLFTDTVGFIRNLPSWIIEAFHSTLEEIKLADLILLVVDIGESISEIKSKLAASFGELVEIEAESPIVIVFNKTDLLKKEELKRRLEMLRDDIGNKDFAFISASDGSNIEELFEMILRNLPGLTRIRISLPFNEDSQKFLSDLYNKAWIITADFKDRIFIDLSVNPSIVDRLSLECKKIGGSLEIK